MNFYTDVIQKHPLFNSASRCADPALLEPVTRDAVQRMVESSPVPIMIFETFRSAQRQGVLFAAKKTELRTVGVHHYGLACDLVKCVDGQPSWEGSFEFLAELVEKVGLISGIDWGQPDKKHTFVDSDHVQRIAVKRQVALFEGSWYPGETYDPYTDEA